MNITVDKCVNRYGFGITTTNDYMEIAFVTKSRST